MKKICRVLAVFFLLLAVIPVPAAAEEGETIRLGYYYVENYMEGMAEGERKTGLAYDILRELAMCNG